jgi:hypothetical protein
MCCGKVTPFTAVPRGPGSPLGGPSDGGPVYGPGSDTSQGMGGDLSTFFGRLKAQMCLKCVTFWIVLAVIAVVVYNKKRG